MLDIITGMFGIYGKQAFGGLFTLVINSLTAFGPISLSQHCDYALARAFYLSIPTSRVYIEFLSDSDFSLSLYLLRCLGGMSSLVTFPCTLDLVGKALF